MSNKNLYRQCPMGSIPYTVMEGELLYTIAAKFNISVDDIISVNPGINPMNIYPGLQICIPQPQVVTPPACPIGTSPYEIKAGDTFYSIALRFGTTVESIIAANPDVNPERLRVGQTICVTEKQPNGGTCPTLNSYVIQRGDTIAAIARSFSVSVQDILSINPGIDPYAMSVGDIICLPLSPAPLSIRISIPAKRLGLYRGGTLEKLYPVATGKPTTPTPIGTFTIVNKQVNPGGPFGTRWMGLSKPHYGIHGTNNPASIGTAASNGCVRMYNEDVNELFNQVSVGTVVRIF